MNKDIHKPMQHIIKDSDLILEKLDELHYDKVTKVVSPFAKANLIIINPSALMDLFLLLRISPPQQNFDLLGLLKFLNKIVSRQSINSLSIYSEGVLHYSGHSRKSLARYLLEYYYELKSKNMGIEFLKQIKKLIISLFKNNYLEKSTIQVIYQQVIKEYYNGNILKETIEDTLDMLHVFFNFFLVFI